MTALTYTPEDLDTLTRTVVGEARGEPEIGQVGVCWVVRNRVEWPDGPHWWGTTVAGVCQRPFQFSCWNTGDPNRLFILSLQADHPDYYRMQVIAKSVLDGDCPDPTGHASHYERIGTAAAWAIGKDPSAIIGKHAFYSLGPKG